MMYIFNGLSYLWMVFFIMIAAGLAKEYGLFAPAYAYVKNTFRSNRFVVVLLSAIGGILPIEGRVTVSAGILDTVAPKCGHGREKMGIVDYMSTHHYYLWSPLEKTVIIPIAAFGITYSAFIGMILPLLVVTILFLGWYIWTQVREEEIVIEPVSFKLSTVIRNVFPMFVAIGAYIYNEKWMIGCFGLLALYYMFLTQQWRIRKLLGYINWEVLIVVTVAIMLGNYFKAQQPVFEDWIRGGMFDPTTFTGMLIISGIGFAASFLMGSSGKFIAFAMLLAQLFGHQYFLWFFAIDYIGYLLSPTHKCVMVGNRYFGTPLTTYYVALGGWSAILISTAGIFTFIL